MTQRVALITGGSRGIGAAIALKLAQDGFDIAITYARNEKAAQKVVSDIEALGRKAVAVQADGGSTDGNIAAITKTHEAFGRLDALVCNAGIYPYGPIAQMTVTQIEDVLNLNLRAAMIETVEALKYMKTGGRLIYIGSAFGERAPFPGISLYTATKAGLIGFTKGVARDLGPQGITANIVEPGPIATDLNPEDGAAAAVIRKFTATESYGKVHDIARTVSFLASPDASYITGASILVDGGLVA